MEAGPRNPNSVKQCAEPACGIDSADRLAGGREQRRGRGAALGPRRGLYGAIVERFHGGDLDAVRDRLAYLDRLGVDAIWLSPINATLPDDFGDAVRGYRRIRRSYGDKADLQALVQAAHERGLRVLMDWVPNHTSRAHPWFQRALRDGPGSRFWGYYERLPGGRPAYYFDWVGLPNLDYSNAQVRRRIVAASQYWVREFGIDGVRVDVAWGVRRRAPEFWPRWTRSLRRVDPGVFLLAEASGRRPYYARSGFDATYDWTRRRSASASSGRCGRGAADIPPAPRSCAFSTTTTAGGASSTAMAPGSPEWQRPCC